VFTAGTSSRTNDFAEHLMTKLGHGRLADGEAVLGEEFGDRAVGSALLPEFGNHVLGRVQFLEALRTARREFRDRLAD
jgi:hypothetical protein